MTRIIISLLIVFVVSCKEHTEQKINSINTDTPKKQIENIPRKTANINAKSELFKIEGTYTFKDNISKCFLELEIFKTDEIYNYKLKTPTRNLKGEVTLNLVEDNDGYYITLNKIEWSENLGALDDEGEPKDIDIKLPQGIEGFLYENSIIIQNYGNSMNYYMQLGECDTKYIELTKTK